MVLVPRHTIESLPEPRADVRRGESNFLGIFRLTRPKQFKRVTRTSVTKPLVPRINENHITNLHQVLFIPYKKSPSRSTDTIIFQTKNLRGSNFPQILTIVKARHARFYIFVAFKPLGTVDNGISYEKTLTPLRLWSLNMNISNSPLTFMSLALKIYP